MDFRYCSKHDFQCKGQRILPVRDTDPIELPKESTRGQASYNQSDSRAINIQAGSEH